MDESDNFDEVKRIKGCVTEIDNVPTLLTILALRFLHNPYYIERVMHGLKTGKQ